MTAKAQRLQSKATEINPSIRVKFYPSNGFDTAGEYLKKGWYWKSHEKVMPTVRGEWFADNSTEAFDVVQNHLAQYFQAYN